MFASVYKYFKTLSRNRPLARRHFFIGAAIVFPLLIIALVLINISPYQTPGSNNSALSAGQAESQDHSTYVRATVLAVHSKPGKANSGDQVIKVKLLDGPDKNEVVSVNRYGSSFSNAAYKRLPVGSKVLLSKAADSGGAYVYADRYRIPGATTILILLLVLIIIIARWRGITSVAGLAISITVLAVFVIPRIIHGHDAYATCIEGAFIIAAASIFVAHGLSKRTTVAFVGAVATLALTIGVTSLSGYLTGLSGFTGEDSLGITYAQQHISLSGLLFGGIIIASLGVLNDITIGQAAAVDEIYNANKRQSGIKLYKRGMSVGREHIAALVNTLALAYVGVALPAIVTTAIYNHAPILVTLNSETVMEEIVRTGVVSISLLLAVPVTTALAAYVLPRWDQGVDRKIKRWLHEL